MIEVNVPVLEHIPNYPYIGVGNTSGCIVLFTAERTGVSLKGTLNATGDYRTDWNEQNYSRMKGKIVLRNKEEGYYND